MKCIHAAASAALRLDPSLLKLTSTRSFNISKLAELRALYDPLSCSDNFGENLYFDVL